VVDVDTPGDTPAERITLMPIGRLFGILVAIAVVLTTTDAAYAASQDTGTAIPEPGTLALLATGVSGLLGASWWLRRK
jgi:hypothetical protein